MTNSVNIVQKYIKLFTKLCNYETSTEHKSSSNLIPR